ncbi:single-stranded DNA-binding protein [Amycolatopsis sp.]|jgi:single-strand DNA-binding protein|uniref:single-stranded DNA-binding protein n=1 Tax=Amycolatopsis sp. TaxID=37632 RepID=UPI002E058E99|nr:single-stranded DNA-binding protein [Amycolatopsis sp.]
MAVGETTVTMVGTVASDLIRRTTKGHDVVSFWLRSTERRRDKETGTWVDGRQLSVRVTCWRKLAESVLTSLGKGDPVIVTGRMYTGEDETGEPRSIPELEASAAGPNLNLCTATLRRTRKARAVERPEFLAWRPMPRPVPRPPANSPVSAAETRSAA